MKVKSAKLQVKSLEVFSKKFVGLFVLSLVVLISVFSFSFVVSKAHAAVGINRQINFQGKLVDNNGLNVADSTYTVVFSLYSTSSGGSAIWTESDSVTTKAGVFQVQLGAGTSLPDNVVFNSDNLYLGIKVGSDAEMTPRIRFTAVPYALNSASLDGVVATQSATGFNLQGGTSFTSNVSFTTGAGALTLQPGLAEGLTIDTNGANTLALGNSANSITFGGTNNPTYLFNGTGGLTVNGTSLTLGNSSNATIQTTNGSNAGLTLLSEGSGNITLGQNAGNGNILIDPNAGGQAALIVKDLGSGDLFTASAGATTRFILTNNGNVQFSGNSGFLNTISTTGTFGSGQTYNLPNQGGIFCLSTNNCGFASGTNYWQLNTNALSPGNGTYDFLLGGNSTASAKFAFLNNAGVATPVASISAQNGTTAPSGLSLSPGAVQSLNDTTLTIGGSTTGNIVIDSGVNVTQLADNTIGLIGSAPIITSTNALQINSGSNTLTFNQGGSGQVQFFGTNNFITSGGAMTLASNGNALNLSGTGANINFSGAGVGQIISAANQNLALMPGTNGDVGINATSGLLAALDVRGNTATTPAGSFSATSTYAALDVNNSGTGDLFTASKSGTTKFVILNSGNIGFAGTNNALSTLASAATNAVTWTLPSAGGIICLQNSANCGFTVGQNYWQSLNTGAIEPFNTTFDLLLGGTSTSSAKFAFIGNAGNVTPIASISANPGSGTGNGLVFNGAGSIQSLNNNTLTIGGNTTGNILLEPLNGTAGQVQFFNGNNTINSSGNLTLAGTITLPSSNTLTGATGLLQLSNGIAFGGSTTNQISNTGVANLASETLTGTANVLTLSGAGANIVFTGNGLAQITTAQNNNLALMPNGSGDVGINVSSGLLGTLDVQGNTGTTPGATISGSTTFAEMVVNNSGTGDLFTASVSGLTKFTILNNGNISWAGSSNFLSTLANNTTAARTWTLPDATGTVCISGQTCATTGTVGYWNLNSAQGTLSPGNTTLDFLVGGVATNSGTTIGTYARAGFLNIAVGTPVASLSAGTSGGAYMSAAGLIQTTANQTLTIGGSTTGNIILNPSAGTYFGVGTQNPLASADIRGAIGLNGGTVAVASISGQTSFAALVINNSGTGDLFTASSAGATKFDITNSGNVLIYGDTITASSAANITNNGSGDFVNGLGDTGSLIPNSSFEASTSAGMGFADEWSKSATSSGALSVDSTTASNGSNSIKVVLGGNGSAAFESTCVPLSLKLISTYNLSFDYKPGAATNMATVRVYVDGYTSKQFCQSNNTSAVPVAQTAVNLAANTNWNTANASTTTAGNYAANTTWGRVRFFIAAPVNAATVNIDAVRLLNTTNTNGLDYAENYPADPNNVPQPGNVVALEASGEATLVTKADNIHQSVLGVVSTKPGEILDDGSMANPVPVALAGRVPVNVSTINGPIHVGDYLTSSDIPGVAVKATAAGPVIGTAMEDFDCPVIADVSEAIPNISEIASSPLSPRNDDCQGQVTMFIKNSYYDPTVVNAMDGNYDLLQNSDLSTLDASSSASASDSGILQPLYTIQTGVGIAVTATTALAKATIANIQAGAVVAKEMSTDSLTVTTGNITLGGQTLSDYIKGIVKQTLSEMDQTGSVAVSVNGLVTATQSAQLVQTMLSQHDLSATVSGMTVTGVLGANTINTNHIAGLVDLRASTITTATLSAQTITADTIKANHIEGLEIITGGLQKDDARITALENMLSTQSAMVAPTGIVASPTAGLAVINDSSLSTTPSGDLRVKGNALVEGVLHIVDTLFANDFIANGVADFFGNVIFHRSVTFENSPTFSSDTAGIAIIKKGADHVDVKFGKAYDQTPVINASITMISLTPTPSETADQLQKRQDDIQQTILADNIRYVVTNRTNNGFTIILENPAEEDIAFSWLALSVQNADIFQSQNQLSPSPTEGISPSPIDSIMPSEMPLSPALSPPEKVND